MLAKAESAHTPKFHSSDLTPKPTDNVKQYDGSYGSERGRGPSTQSAFFHPVYLYARTMPSTLFAVFRILRRLKLKTHDLFIAILDVGQDGRSPDSWGMVGPIGHSSDYSWSHWQWYFEHNTSNQRDWMSQV